MAEVARRAGFRMIAWQGEKRTFGIGAVFLGGLLSNWQLCPLVSFFMVILSLDRES